MRVLIYALCVCAVVALGFWAYREGYETRATEREVAALQRQIGQRHQELSMLRAEWAYLNRPDRLRVLAEMNFERLGLMELSPDHFALTEQVGYPVPPIGMIALGGLTDTPGQAMVGADGVTRNVAPPMLAADGEMLP